ncbi:hypothetical protein TNCV_4160671 [Trichonephila clavipes]|nr:hypothetical protein TNCV_4160671 [Trichonephila clavipes]
MSSFPVLCEEDTRNRWRDGQVCPDVGQGRERKKVGREHTEGEDGRQRGEREEEKESSERERSRPWREKMAESGIGVERR